MWDGYREFVIDRIEPESESAKSFYLVPRDGGRCAPYRPGQHLQFRLRVADGPPLLRFYTISDCHNDHYYRLTIKRESPPAHLPDAPPGAASTHFHDCLRVGDVLEVKAPAGDFFLDLEETRPAVLIAGGIGVTPLISMINAVVARGIHQRQIHFFHAVRHGGDHAFKDHLFALAAEHPNIHLHICYDQPRPSDQLGRDYHWHGRVDLDRLHRLLPTLDMAYYICGPSPMMKAVVGSLEEAGIASTQIHTESFGPASTAYRKIKTDIQAATSANGDDAIQVNFARSGKVLRWTTQYESLLQFAEANNVNISSGCCFGDCATCMTPLREGEVAYNHPTAVTPDPGTCLPCSCRPTSSVTLDA